MMDGKCCGGTSTMEQTGAGGALMRPRWFPGQLVSDRDLTDEAEYFLQLIRLHNRMLIGWGTVCGLKVCPVLGDDGAAKPWLVRIEPGLALSPWGDYIVVTATTEVDLRRRLQNGPSGEPIDPGTDPWCSDVYRRPELGPIFLGVRYWRAMTRPVRTPPAGCGCSESRCEYSRWLDSFQVCFLDDCPPSHRNPPDLDSMFEGELLSCPPCPEDDCVLLAKIEIDEEGGIVSIDNCCCRRNVAARPHFWWACEQIKVPDTDDSGGKTNTEATADAPATPARRNVDL